MGSFSKSIKQAADDAERLGAALRSLPQGDSAPSAPSGGGGGGFVPALPSGPVGVGPPTINFITHVNTTPLKSARQGGPGGGGGGTRLINGLPIPPQTGILASGGVGSGGGGGGKMLATDVKGLAREIVRQLGGPAFSGDVLMRSSGGS